MALLLGTAALTGGLVAISVAEHNRRRAALRSMLSDPLVQADIAHMSILRDSIPISVLFVHVGQADLSSNLAGAKIRVRVKYGRGGTSLQQVTRTLQAHKSENGERMLLDFGETFAFPQRLDDAHAVRIKIEKIGFLDQVISKAEVPIDYINSGFFEHDVCLFGSGFGRKNDLVGQLNVSTSLRQMTRGELLGRPTVPTVGVTYGVPPMYQYDSGYDAEYEAAIAESLRMSRQNSNSVPESCAAAVPAEVTGHPMGGAEQHSAAPIVVQGRVVQ